MSSLFIPTVWSIFCIIHLYSCQVEKSSEANQKDPSNLHQATKRTRRAENSKLWLPPPPGSIFSKIVYCKYKIYCTKYCKYTIYNQNIQFTTKMYNIHQKFTIYNIKQQSLVSKNCILYTAQSAVNLSQICCKIYNRV